MILILISTISKEKVNLKINAFRARTILKARVKFTTSEANNKGNNMMSLIKNEIRIHGKAKTIALLAAQAVAVVAIIAGFYGMFKLMAMCYTGA